MPVEDQIDPGQKILEQAVRVPDYPPADPVQEKERAWHEWMGIAVGLSALVAIVSLIVGLAALGSTSTKVEVITAAGPAAAPAAATPSPRAETIGVSIKADSEHGRLGPDRQWHDAFLPADITVGAGDRVTLTLTNYDSGPHTFTSPALGVNQVIPGGGSLSTPHVVTLTFLAPKKGGRYAWWCAIPCDPWAMMHDGYMRGFVTVRA